MSDRGKGSGRGGEDADFYVGYLPVPASHRAMLRVVIPAVLLIGGGVAALLAGVQRDPGAAVWREEVEELTGVMLAHPVPMLLTDEGRRAVLLVEEGKHGAQVRAQTWAGKRVTVRGRVLTREGGGRMVELLAQAGAVRDAEGLAADGAGGGVPGLDGVGMGEVVLRGEIVDSKCFHGAMKPGDGKGHKACATLCVRNGIPAMIAAEEGGLWLLVVDGGMDADTLSKVGEPVEVRGTATRLADVQVVTIAGGSVRRVR